MEIVESGGGRDGWQIDKNTEDRLPDTASDCGSSVDCGDSDTESEDNALSTEDIESSAPRTPCKQFEYVDFHPKALVYVGKRVLSPRKADEFTRIGRVNNMGFKMVKSDTKLIKALLHSYGFTQCSARNPSFNVLWTSAHLKPHVLRCLQPWQRVNHFPRSGELTRKDKLYENVARARRQHGLAYDFVPEFYVTPRDMSRLNSAMISAAGHSKGPAHLPFIVKPVCMSRGRGIYFASKPGDISLASNLLVSRYIDNPLLVNGHKFDLRVYVAVTSFFPLVCYIYSEGLTRFASEKYTAGGKPGDEFVHLTNYSVNKNSKTFVRNETFSSEDFGHKWTLGALLRHLEKEGMDARLLMLRIEDLVIKSLLSAQSSIAAVCRSTLSSCNTCFELFGFDVLVDSDLKPWLLEVNLSPSLTCDAPLDSVVKTRLICDLFNLACIPIMDRKASRGTYTESNRAASDSPSSLPAYVSPRAVSRSLRRPLVAKRVLPSLRGSPSAQELRSRAHQRKLRVEFGRRGGFVRVFPRKGSWLVYGPIMDHIGGEKWDEKLYEDEFGLGDEKKNSGDGEDDGVEDEEDDDEDVKERVELRSRFANRVHEQLMRCDKFPDESCLSPEIRSLFSPWLESTDAYLQKITKEGEKYMAKLPSVRSSARLRTKSCAEFYELRAARLNDDVIDMITKGAHTDSRVSTSDGKENAIPTSLTAPDISLGISLGRTSEIIQQLSSTIV